MPPRTRKKEDVERETGDGRPTIADVEGENLFAQVAKKLWLGKKTTKVKVKPDVLKKEIWDVLEKEDFTFKSLLVLENLQILPSYLWPGYSEDSSNFHVLLVVLISNVRTREHLSTWGEWSLNDLNRLRLISGRYLYQQPDRILQLVSSNIVHDFGYHPQCNYSDSFIVLHYQRLPIFGYWHR